MLSLGSKKNYVPPGKNDPKSLKAMIIGGACLAKSEKEQKINLAPIPKRHPEKVFGASDFSDAVSNSPSSGKRQGFGSPCT